MVTDGTAAVSGVSILLGVTELEEKSIRGIFRKEVAEGFVKDVGGGSVCCVRVGAGGG